MTHAEQVRAEFKSICERQETEFERRFNNWVRWCSAKDHAKGHCFSVEHRYRVSEVFGNGSVSIPIDSKDAARFDEAYRTLMTASVVAAGLIKARYFKLQSNGRIAREFHFKFEMVSERIQYSLKMLEKHLRELERKL